jgi:hypothetical protein
MRAWYLQERTQAMPHSDLAEVRVFALVDGSKLRAISVFCGRSAFEGLGTQSRSQELNSHEEQRELDKNSKATHRWGS